MERTSETGTAGRCDRAAEWEPLLYDFAEGLTDEKTGQEIKRHIAECAYCRGALEDIRWMTAALRESAPEPKTDISARVMDVIRAEEESDGRIVTQAVDVRTGRVLSSPKEKRGIRVVLRTVSGIAAAMLVVLGLMLVVPLLRAGSGTASGTQDILGEMQSGEDDRFSGGVFVGCDPAMTAETVSAETGTEIIPAETQNPVILRIVGLSEERLVTVLSDLTAADGTPATFTKTRDGYLVAPLSAFETAQGKLHAAYPALGIEIVRAEETPQSYTEDAFYIQIQ